MQKIVYSMLVSLDGYIAGPNQDISWITADDELHTHFSQQERLASATLYGRRLYEVMRYWETVDDNSPNSPQEIEYARSWQNLPKVVFSTTLTEVGPNTRLVRENIAEEIARLKAMPGQELTVGGAGLAATLGQLGLIDEYRLYVQPVVLGAGTPFFPTSGPQLNLKFINTHTFGNGTVLMHYQALPA